MAWDKDKPAGSQKLRLADDDIRANNAAIDAVFNAMLVAGTAVTATAAEINATCDGNTATAAELSELHSQGAVAADFAKLHALTASASEINSALDGITAGYADLNKVPGIVAGTQALSALDVNGNGDISGTANIHDTLTLSKASGNGLVITANIDANGNMDLAGTANIHDALTLSKASGNGLVVTANADLNGNLDVAGTFHLATGATINELSTDGTFAGNSDSAVPTEKASKTYADSVASTYLLANAMLPASMAEEETEITLTSPTGWVTKRTYRIYIPPGATSIAGKIRGKNSSAAEPAEYRLVCSTSTGTAATTTSGTYTWLSVTLDITGLSGWQDLEIQMLKHSSYTAYMQGYSFKFGT